MPINISPDIISLYSTDLSTMANSSSYESSINAAALSRHSPEGAVAQYRAIERENANSGLLGREDVGVLSMLRNQKPLNPQYVTREARLRTFRYWPPALHQEPQQLAEAGFYYEGQNDQVVCFSCDGCIRE